MAQVTARKRGAGWEYRFELALVGGKRKQHSKGGYRTKREALKAGNEAYNFYITAGTTPINTDTSVSDFIEKWIEVYAKPNLRRSTVSTYTFLIDEHINPKIGKYMMRSVTQSLLQSLLNQMAIDGYKRETIGSVKAIMRKAFAYASGELRIINPADSLTVPKNAASGNEKVQAYDMNTAALYIEKLQGTTGYYPAMIALHTGMRAGEILALTWNDINFESRTIDINKTMSYANKKTFIGPVKSSKGHRKISFGVELEKALKRCKLEQTEHELYYGEHYILCYADTDQTLCCHSKSENVLEMKRFDLVVRHENGKYVTRSTFYYRLKAALGTDFKFHNFRHSHATMLYEGKRPIKEIQERLGHASAATTLDMYVNPSGLDAESAHVIEAAWAKRGQEKENVAK